MPDQALRTRLKRKPAAGFKSSDLLSTGSTLLNLACSGRGAGGLVKGCYYLLAGDSNSGKTWIALSLLAEASVSPHFTDYRFVHDDPENGALMDLIRYFGKGLGRRLEKPEPSRTLEEFHYRAYEAFRAGPCVYLLDSMDALVPEDDFKKFGKQKKAAAEGEEAAGTYGTSKAKKNSANLRLIHNACRASGSILIMISQSRMNIGFGARFNPKTRSGGLALSFYAQIEIWTALGGHIKKVVRKKPRELGIYSRVHVKRSRVTGKDRTVTVPIYHSVGIDDLGGCVDYLVGEGHWPVNKEGVITAGEWGQFRREALVAHVEENGLEGELRADVVQLWNEIESACTVRRKPRYE